MIDKSPNYLVSLIGKEVIIEYKPGDKVMAVVAEITDVGFHTAFTGGLHFHFGCCRINHGERYEDIYEMYIIRFKPVNSTKWIVVK